MGRGINDRSIKQQIQQINERKKR